MQCCFEPLELLKLTQIPQHGLNLGSQPLPLIPQILVYCVFPREKVIFQIFIFTTGHSYTVGHVYHIVFEFYSTRYY